MKLLERLSHLLNDFQKFLHRTFECYFVNNIMKLFIGVSAPLGLGASAFCYHLADVYTQRGMTVEVREEGMTYEGRQGLDALIVQQIGEKKDPIEVHAHSEYASLTLTLPVWNPKTTGMSTASYKIIKELLPASKQLQSAED